MTSLFLLTILLPDLLTMVAPTMDELNGLIRPNQAYFYRRVLANMASLARKQQISPDAISVFLGQSRAHTGKQNAYLLLCPAGYVSYSGQTHQPNPDLIQHVDHLRGPISRAQILAWMEACPDYEAPRLDRPGN